MRLFVFLLLAATAAVEAFEVFSVYGSQPSNVADIDLDQRSIVAKTALSNGLEEVKKIYQEGSHAPPMTLQKMSLELPYKDFELFKAAVDLHGWEQYADQWMKAFLDGKDSQSLAVEGRSTAVRWGTVVWNVWMYVVALLEQAVSTCSAEAWDDAFAYYAGSLVETELPLGGFLLYSLGQTRCVQFGTCPKDQEAPVNAELLQHFVQGKEYIAKTKCSQINLQRMRGLLTVPLIQACIKSAYAIDKENDHRPETLGEAAAFSAAAATAISSCSRGSAGLVLKDFFTTQNAAHGSFEVVKAAFERQYTCLGITCADVGGLTTLQGTYLDGAEACNNVMPVAGSVVTTSNSGGSGGLSSSSPSRPSSSSSSSSSQGPQTSLVVGLLIAVVGGAALLTLCAMCCLKKNSKALNTNPEDQDAEDVMVGDLEPSADLELT